MFLELDYKALDLYTLGKKLVFSCYELSQGFPEEEKANISMELRSAGLSAYLNIARALMNKSKRKKRRFLKKSRQNLKIIDACIDLLFQLKFINKGQLEELENSLLPCYRLLKRTLKR